jgi:DNA mismatch repair protein MutL
VIVHAISNRRNACITQPPGNHRDEALLQPNPARLNNCRVERFRGSGRGGQKRNVTDSAVRVTHEPTGVAAESDATRSQTRNREQALRHLRKRIAHLFGKRMDSRLVPLGEDTQVVQLNGFICKPEYAKKSRGTQFFFVNRRFIKSPYLHHAVMNAYEGLLRPDTLPGYFIFLQVPEDSIDINIHPTKTEIKFEDEQSLYAILRSAVKHSLGQFNIRPVLDFEKDQNLETPYQYKDRQARVPEVTVDRNFNPFSESGPAGGRPSYTKPRPACWEALYEGLEEGEEKAGEPAPWVVESGVGSEPLFPPEALQGISEVVSLQLDQRFILTRVKSGLLLIDQHRAHQRVLYEQFLPTHLPQHPLHHAQHQSVEHLPLFLDVLQILQVCSLLLLAL